MHVKAHAEVRTDNGKVLNAFLSTGAAPATRIMTDDSTQVTQEEFFQIELGSDTFSVGWANIIQTLPLIICVLIKTGLTAEQERALIEQVPALKLTPR